MSVATLPEARRRPFLAPPVPIIAIAAIAVFVLFVGATLAVAGSTLGFDFLAYHAAAVRVLHGQPLFDTSFTAAGSFGLFYYPPTFLPLILPFGLLEPTVATWTWTAILLGAFALGIAVLPVSIRTRWLIVLLAGLSWPFVYAVKLGQVGPLLFLAFAIGWRTLDRPLPLGVSTAAGTAITLQPGVVFVWALLTRRWRAVVIGLAVLVALAVAATVLSGARIWPDFITLAQRVSNPITLEHNLTPGAVLYRLGVPAATATLAQLVAMALVVVAVVYASLRRASDVGYLVAVVASQLLSPILWDHYALLLLLPVAWLLERRRWWAALIPLATSVPLIGITPDVVYPLAFVAAGIALLTGMKGGSGKITA
ncbi:MAG: glycosyltransferase family 87 protein [Chloroflexota bacterium]